MKKAICLLVAVLLCASMVFPAFAEDNDFVDSITYKDGPKILRAEMDGEDVTRCLIITSILEARNKSTDILQDERDLLLEVYEALSNGSMTLPVDFDYVIRELVDLSFRYEECRVQTDHDEDVKILEDGVVLTVDFDLGVGADAVVSVLTYEDGVWTPIVSVTNNGDGTVTCVFEEKCPVVFLVDQSSYNASADTGDAQGTQIGLWIGLLCVSAVALVGIVLVSRKKKSN